MARQTNKELFLNVFANQVDVQLKAGDSDHSNASAISAHKRVLSARSEVFKKMWESDDVCSKASTNLETITLTEMKHTELEVFVEFIYGEGSMLSKEAKQHVGSLYKAADKYEIPHLRDLCRAELIASLDSSNALNVLELAQIPFDKDLNDAAFTFIETNIRTIYSSAEFKIFIVNHPNLTVEIVNAVSTRRWATCNTCGKTCRHCCPWKI